MATAVLAAAMLIAAGAGCGEDDAPAPLRAERPLALERVPRAEVAACERRAAEVDPPRCPSRLPAPVTGGLDVEGTGDFSSGGCGWLRGLAYRDAGVPVFHVLSGASCAPLRPADLGVAARADVLRLVGSAPLRPGDSPGTRQRPIAPRVGGTTTVRGRRAAVLHWADFERAGTIHGGHDGLAWNEDGAGRVLSLHFAPQVPHGVRVATLRAAAASMR